MVRFTRQYTGGTLVGLGLGLAIGAGFNLDWEPVLVLAALTLTCAGSILVKSGQRIEAAEHAIRQANPDRYTDRAKSVLQKAKANASARHAKEVTPEDLLTGLLQTDRGVGQILLENNSVRLEMMRTEVSELTPRPTEGTDPGALDPGFSPETLHILAWAKEEARQLNHRYLGTEHLVLGMLRDNASPVGALLARHSLSLDAARQAVRSLVGPTS